MSGIHPDDLAQAEAYESGRTAGSAAVAEMQRAAHLESAQHIWLLGFLQGALDAAGRATYDQSRTISNNVAPSQTRDTATALRDSPIAMRISAIESFGQNADDQHDWLSLALDTGPLGVRYAPGSALALWPANDPEHVRRILRMLDASAQVLIPTDSGEEPAWQILLERVDLSTTSTDAIRLLAEYSRSGTESKGLLTLAEEPSNGARPLLPLLRRYPSARPPIEALLKRLSPLKPSFVPIASSFLEQSKLLLVTVESGRRGIGWGQVSGTIRSRLRVGEWLSASVDEREFPAMLHADDAEPVIIICDGPSVAHARAFAAERHERHAKGRTWIVVTGVASPQFPYAHTLATWHRAGVLTRFDVAPGFEASDLLRALGDREENLWRWFVDHSRFFVIARRQSIRAAVSDWFAALIARRYRLEHDDATQRVHELSEQGQWLILPQLAVA